VKEIRLLRPFLLLAASVIGFLAFFYPFVLPLLGVTSVPNGRSVEVPLLFAALATCALLLLLLLFQEQTVQRGQSRALALLAVLIAFDAALRLLPSLLGASPIFLLIIVTGYVFGSAYGFVMGAMTLALSAIITGGIGPWLPFQMLTAGWVGMTASWLPKWRGTAQRLALTLFGSVWGFLFGAIMNLWFWPFAAPGLSDTAGLYWHPGMSLSETLQTYWKFYLATSLVFDGTRALGNALLVFTLGPAIVNVMQRYRDRFIWQPWAAEEHQRTPQTDMPSEIVR